MNAAITRRKALAVVPAVAAAVLPAASAFAAVEQDPHPKWWVERQEWRRKMSAIAKEIDRREAMLPAEVRAPLLRTSHPYEDFDSLMDDLRPKMVRRKAAAEQAGIPRLDAEYDRAADHKRSLERLIHDTEARTAAGLAVQLRLLEFRATTDEIDPEDVGCIAAGLERLAGGGAS